MVPGTRVFSLRRQRSSPTVPEGSHLFPGKPRNESIIAALTGQQTPENDKEDRQEFMFHIYIYVYSDSFGYQYAFEDRLPQMFMVYQRVCIIMFPVRLPHIVGTTHFQILVDLQKCSCMYICIHIHTYHYISLCISRYTHMYIFIHTYIYI